MSPCQDVCGSNYPLFFINMTRQAPPDTSDCCWGSQAPCRVPPARANDSCLVLLMTLSTSRIRLLYSKKNGGLASDSVSARLWSASPRRDSIRRFQPVLGGYSITQFRARAPRTYHSVGRKEPRNKINWGSNWQPGPLNVRGVWGLAPTWFKLVGSRLSFKGAPLHVFGTQLESWETGPIYWHIVE